MQHRRRRLYKTFIVCHVSYFEQVFRDKFLSACETFSPKCGFVVENCNNLLLKFFGLYDNQLTNSLPNQKQTNELTEWSRTFLQNLRIRHLFSKIPTFYCSLRFVSVFTNPPPYFRPYHERDVYIPRPPILFLMFRFNIIFLSAPSQDNLPSVYVGAQICKYISVLACPKR